jgi:hypothetical protein
MTSDPKDPIDLDQVRQQQETESVTEQEEAPVVAGEMPPHDPTIIGTMTPEEMGQIQSLRQRGSQLTMEIGTVEIHKARLLGEMSKVDADTQTVLRSAQKRLGIPEGQAWRMLQSGQAQIIPAQDPAPEGPKG